nr:hypothetical protein GCM10020241_64880 [Streptoalloteichus tenebrarius]
MFGRIDTPDSHDATRLRLPPAPGAHVVCANKDASVRGPGYVWSIIAIAIAEDQDVDASLFIEDCGFVPGSDVGQNELRSRLRWHLSTVAKSIMYCGQDQGVSYKEIFTGCKYLRTRAHEWGCALSCAPYVLLAQRAVPTGRTPRSLLDLTLEQWEELMGWQPLPPPPHDDDIGGIGVGIPRRPGAEAAAEDSLARSSANGRPAGDQ